MTAAAFDTRLARLVRKHRRMATGGVAYRIEPDGLITAHPRRSLSALFPMRTLAMLGLSLVALKALMLMSLGESTYGTRVEELRSGSGLERAGAWVMQADPATTTIATVLRDMAA